MKRYWTGILGQVQAFQRRFLRDKVSLFFTFLFPLIFLFVFGSIFKNQTVNFKVGIINHSHSQFAQQFVDNATKGKDSVLKVKDVKGLDDAKETGSSSCRRTSASRAPTASPGGRSRSCTRRGRIRRAAP